MDRPITLEQVIGFLDRTPLFEDLEPAELAEIVRILQVRTVRDGHHVFREGEDGDGWYVLFRGEVVVTRRLPLGGRRTVAVLGPHDCFGEMAVLDGRPRSATVTARGDTVLFRFPRDAFSALVARGDRCASKLLYGLARVLCERQRRLTAQLADLATAGRLDAPLGHLVDRCSVSE